MSELHFRLRLSRGADDDPQQGRHSPKLSISQGEFYRSRTETERAARPPKFASDGSRGCSSAIQTPRPAFFIDRALVLHRWEFCLICPSEFQIVRLVPNLAHHRIGARPDLLLEHNWWLERGRVEDRISTNHVCSPTPAPSTPPPLYSFRTGCLRPTSSTTPMRCSAYTPSRLPSFSQSFMPSYCRSTSGGLSAIPLMSSSSSPCSAQVSPPDPSLPIAIDRSCLSPGDRVRD